LQLTRGFEAAALANVENAVWLDDFRMYVPSYFHSIRKQPYPTKALPQLVI
jgi:hypothetical protein